ncbi:unnamed protein product, partial [Didymodactylos carnosus]
FLWCSIHQCLSNGDVSNYDQQKPLLQHSSEHDLNNNKMIDNDDEFVFHSSQSIGRKSFLLPSDDQSSSLPFDFYRRASLRYHPIFKKASLRPIIPHNARYPPGKRASLRPIISPF